MTFGPRAEALASLARAHDLFGQLHHEDPRPTLVRDNLGTACARLGQLHRLLGRPAQAVPFCQQARDLWEPLAREAPDDRACLSALGNADEELGLALWQLGRRDEALAALRQAVAHQQAALARAPDQAEYRSALDRHYRLLAEALRDFGHPAEAAAVSLERRQLWPASAWAAVRAGWEITLCLPLIAHGSPALAREDAGLRHRLAGDALAAFREAAKRAVGWRRLRRWGRKRERPA